MGWLVPIAQMGGCQENSGCLATAVCPDPAVVQSLICVRLWPQGLQRSRLPCLSLSLRICSNSCPLNWWCFLTISSDIPISSCLHVSQHQALFQWVGSLHQWPKYWSFSISPSNEYSGLISFRIDRFDLLAVQGTVTLEVNPDWSKPSLIMSFPFASDWCRT